MNSSQFILNFFCNFEFIICSISSRDSVPFLSVSRRMNSFWIKSSSCCDAYRPDSKLKTIFWNSLLFWYCAKFYWIFRLTSVSCVPICGMSLIHGCSNRSDTHTRLYWSFSRQVLMKFLAFSLISRHYRLLNVTSLLQMFVWIRCKFLPSKGVLPHKSWYVMIPRLQTSTLSVYLSLLTSSGAMYSGVPKKRSIPFSTSNFWANPRSDILRSSVSLSSETSRMFSGFKSRCVMFYMCK